MRRSRALIAATSASLAALALTAIGGAWAVPYPGDARQSVTVDFDAEKPGVPSGLELGIEYVNPSDPDAKPPAVRKVVVKLAKGSRIDTLALPSCGASDLELIALGADACPADSLITTGVAVVDTGIEGPFREVIADIEFFNNDDELIYLNTVRGVGVRTVIRGRISGRKLTTEPGMLPGAPPDGGAIKSVTVHDPEISRTIDGELHSYVTTPPKCPKSGRWTHKVRFTYADGVTQIARDRDRCERGMGS